MYIILVYDIVTDVKGKKILPKVFKTCKKYLTHIQNSVFEGELSPPQLKKLKIEISELVRDNKTRQEKWLEKEMIGLQNDETDNFI